MELENGSQNCRSLRKNYRNSITARYDTHNKLFEGRNSYSKTDPDATFMHMKDDHMCKAQLKPSYNVQIGVESEYITGVGIFQDRNDTATLIPFLNDMEFNLKNRYQNIIADSGYEIEENYLYLEEREQTHYIKPQTYEKWKKKSFKNDISKRENMFYNTETDEYTCQNGKQLKPVGILQKAPTTRGLFCYAQKQAIREKLNYFSSTTLI